jgi:hypothetical protein
MSIWLKYTFFQSTKPVQQSAIGVLSEIVIFGLVYSNDALHSNRTMYLDEKNTGLYVNKIIKTY